MIYEEQALLGSFRALLSSSVYSNVGFFVSIVKTAQSVTVDALGDERIELSNPTRTL